MAAQSNLNVSLTPRFLEMVRDRVDSGRYQSASEVIRDGLRLLEERDQGQQAFWSEVRKKVGQGKAQLKEGSGIASETFLHNLTAHVRKVKASRRHKSKSGKRP